MDYNEFGERIKAKYPEYKDMDNLELSRRIVAKYPEYKEHVSFDLPNSDIQLNSKEYFLQKNRENLQKRKEWEQEHPIISRMQKDFSPLYRIQSKAMESIDKYGTDITPTELLSEGTKAISQGLIPAANIGTSVAIGGIGGASKAFLPTILRGAGQGAIQGTVAETLDELGDNGLSTNVLKRGVEGATGGAVGGGVVSGLTNIATPIVNASGKLVNKLFLNSFPGLKEKTVRRLINPNSKALDLNEDTAQNLLMNTTERVRDSYNKITNQKGNIVGNLLHELPEDVNFKVGDILQDYDKIYNNYSLSRNEALNPAINATKKEYSKIQDMLYSNSDKNINEFKQGLDDLRYPRMDLEVLRGKHKGNFYTKSLDSMQNNIEIAYRRFNGDIIDRIKNNPELLENANSIQHFENIIQDMNNKVPDEIIEDMYSRLYQIIGSSDKLNKANYTVNPKELYDINKNISDMTDWKAVDAATKNDVLEQMYGANAARISNLSPELAAANKEYSQLMDFRNNEGIDRILNKRERIDNASSALRNYNTTITKGNTNRNIQDLENLFIKEGEQPFLNDIDDVNAANELLKTVETGFNPLGITDKLKNMVETPILKGARAANRFLNTPQIQNIYNAINKPIPDSVRRLLTPLAVRSSVPMLYGGISND